MVSLIKIGEESGKLTENINVIATQQQKDKAFRSKVSSAMMYPLLVMGMTIIVGIGIAWFILPR
jgi:type IV pilus assembly protein PilC